MTEAERKEEAKKIAAARIEESTGIEVKDGDYQVRSMDR
jgi:hypothetical protein